MTPPPAATLLATPPAQPRPRSLFSSPFTELEVGYEFTTPGRTICETDVVFFSQWTGDTLPVHTDRHWAEENGLYGRRVANGLLVVSYALGLLPLDGDYVVALRRVRELIFKRPVFLGDTVHCEGRIEALRNLDAFGCVVTHLSIRNQDGEVVVRGTFDMLWRMDDPPSRVGVQR
jgi:3-hydroxybutyryl-CoA dehydratase